jgi:Ca2+-binding EF-hand superfamily protein
MDSAEENTSKIIEKVFREFDDNANGRFSRMEFPKVVKVITNLIGVDDATEDDVEDIFNLLDVNGDQSLDRKELESLFRVFFKMLEERDIQVSVSNPSDIVENPS